MKEQKDQVKWYDDANTLTNIIILIAFLTLLVSQSLAVNNHLTPTIMLRNLLNHNAIFIVALLYFILLKTKLGRTNFNVINIIYIILYILITGAAIFTLLQSFGLPAILSLISNLLILCFMVYTFLPETRLWKDFNINKLPFDEISSEYYYYAISIITLIQLLINLIGSANLGGVILTLFDTAYLLLFSRYIYLYKIYCEKKAMNKDKDDISSKQKESMIKKKDKNTETNNEEKPNKPVKRGKRKDER